jgi:proline iminopeptidase
MLDVGGGHRIYWQVRGNPDAQPAVIVHGGPGSGMPKGTPKLFDPQRYRTILFDQRGCGRSTPHASDPATDLGGNTTAHLLDDLDLLRQFLDVDRWLMFGGSFGSGLSLAYAQRHPHRVSALILPSLWLMGSLDVDWLYRGGVARLFPREWDEFRHGHRGQAILESYVDKLADPDPAVRAAAAMAWTCWEDAVLSLEPGARPAFYQGHTGPAAEAFARICSWYAAHDGFGVGDTILDAADRLAGIPGVIIHGRHDLSCPADRAWQLAQRWTDAELTINPDSGHQGSSTAAALTYEAVDRFAG